MILSQREYQELAAELDDELGQLYSEDFPGDEPPVMGEDDEDEDDEDQDDDDLDLDEDEDDEYDE